MGKKKEITLSEDDLEDIAETGKLLDMLEEKGLSVKSLRKTLKYQDELLELQTELIHMQRTVIAEKRRVAIVFEGRDAAGKGGTIRRFRKHMIPRSAPVVALSKPSDVERGQWYFQRYVAQLPNEGEVRFYDRSWYNRAVVEPVMGFCTGDEYELFMKQVIRFESMLRDDGIELIKFWLEISKDEQAERFDARRESPLKRWKIGPVDEKAQGLWDEYSEKSAEMFRRTHTEENPWILVQADSKKKARLACMRHVLSTLDYEDKGKTGVDLEPDPEVLAPYRG